MFSFRLCHLLALLILMYGASVFTKCRDIKQCIIFMLHSIIYKYTPSRNQLDAGETRCHWGKVSQPAIRLHFYCVALLLLLLLQSCS